MQIKSFLCRIQIDGHDATEYGEESSDDDGSKTCYISSEEGKARFSFSVDFTNPENTGKALLLL